jgi:hypothetical protein
LQFSVLKNKRNTEIMKQREVKQEILLENLLSNLYLARWNATDSQVIALLFISN